jgi:hypothetical protein
MAGFDTRMDAASWCRTASGCSQRRVFSKTIDRAIGGVDKHRFGLLLGRC